MNQQPSIADLETSKRLLANLRRTRLELQETNLELAQVNAKLADEIREQRLKRIRNTLAEKATTSTEL